MGSQTIITTMDAKVFLLLFGALVCLSFIRAENEKDEANDKLTENTLHELVIRDAEPKKKKKRARGNRRKSNVGNKKKNSKKGKRKSKKGKKVGRKIAKQNR